MYVFNIIIKKKKKTLFNVYKMLKQKIKSYRSSRDSDDLPLRFSESSFDDAITWRV